MRLAGFPTPRAAPHSSTGRQAVRRAVACVEHPILDGVANLRRHSTGPTPLLTEGGARPLLRPPEEGGEKQGERRMTRGKKETRREIGNVLVDERQIALPLVSNTRNDLALDTGTLSGPGNPPCRFFVIRRL